QSQWLDLLERLAREAQSLDQLDREEDPAQLAFELNALLVAANISFILQGDPAALGRARTAIEQRLSDTRPLPAGGEADEHRERARAS
ncbi:MAG: TetR family transcriptional regulator C-terminal domain-containing protein, partial [Solirubrobacterales bacterium]